MNEWWLIGWNFLSFEVLICLEEFGDMTNKLRSTSTSLSPIEHNQQVDWPTFPSTLFNGSALQCHIVNRAVTLEWFVWRLFFFQTDRFVSHSLVENKLCLEEHKGRPHKEFSVYKLATKSGFKKRAENSIRWNEDELMVFVSVWPTHVTLFLPGQKIWEILVLHPSCWTWTSFQFTCIEN